MSNTKKSFVTRKQVKSMINSHIETKLSLFPQSDVNISDIGSTIALLNINGGTEQNNRTGNSIRLTGMYARLTMTLPAAIQNNYARVRVVVYQPKKASVPLAAINWFQAIDMDAFNVYHDKIYHLDSNGAGNSMTKEFKLKFKKGGRLVTYSNNNGSNIVQNDLRMYLVSDQDAFNPCVMDGYIRIFYKDA